MITYQKDTDDPNKCNYAIAFSGREIVDLARLTKAWGQGNIFQPIDRRTYTPNVIAYAE